MRPSLDRSARSGVRVGLLCILLCFAAPLPRAASQFGVLPPDESLGYALGARFSEHVDILRYFRTLADESERVRYESYGRTVGDRELIQVVIGLPTHLDRLDEILALNAELAREGTSEARAREIAAVNPAVIYLSYGIHGDEASSSEAALWTAFDLASGASAAGSVLDSLIVVIDPDANPDGRARYVQWYRSVVGASPDPDPQTREHRQPWPSGRFNHYLFDLNRDWAWMTQPETRARLSTWWRWNPQVHVDFHEMGPNSTYFFFPAAAPINPIYPDHVREWWSRFGRANAREFDERGWTYFTAEGFDMLYPGYGDTWPSLHGAIGMTYEQAGGGSAGLAYARDRDTLTLADRATQHRAAGHATLRAAAAEKTRLLMDFAAAHRTAGEGHPDILLVPGGNPERLNALVDHLLAQGIAVERAESRSSVTASPYPGYTRRSDFPSGTILVRAAQPRGRLAATLLQPDTDLRAEYSYDISSWSLVYAYGVEAHQTRSALGTGWVDAAAQAPAGGLAPNAGYGYLIAPGDSAAAGVFRYLKGGGAVRVLGRSSTFGGRLWPAGTWVIPAAPDGLDVAALEAAGLGHQVVPVASGLSEAGADLGSSSTRSLSLPRIAIVGGDDVAPASYGAHWFYLERDLGLTPHAILLEDLSSLSLERYDVIVVPDMQRPEAPPGVAETLGEWVRAGGHLVAVGAGAEAMAGVGEVGTRQPREDEEDENAALDRLLATREERERQEWREAVPGVTLPVRLDSGHPFAWGASFDGADERIFVLHLGGRTFEPMEGAETVAAFGPDLRTVSGSVDAERLRRIERSAWLLTVPVGGGDLTLFADDPLFRLFWHATKPLYRNAVLYGGF